jgi:hypothetical protein
VYRKVGSIRLRAAHRLIVTACRHEPPREARLIPCAGPAGLRSGEDE